MFSAPRRRRRTSGRLRQSGQGLVEYALILILIAVVTIAALAYFGSALADQLSSIGSSV